MKKLESSFANMVIVLTVITIIAAACLGAMNNATAEPIAASKKAKQEIYNAKSNKEFYLREFCEHKKMRKAF